MKPSVGIDSQRLAGEVFQLRYFVDRLEQGKQTCKGLVVAQTDGISRVRTYRRCPSWQHQI